MPPSKFVIGLGRGFVSRYLLEMKTLDDAVKFLDTVDFSGGHNYNLFDI